MASTNTRGQNVRNDTFLYVSGGLNFGGGVGEPFLKIRDFWARLRRHPVLGVVFDGWSSCAEVCVVPRPLPQGGDAKRGTGLTLAARADKTCNSCKIFKKLQWSNKPLWYFQYPRGQGVPPFPPSVTYGAAATKCVSSVVGFFWRRPHPLPPPLPLERKFWKFRRAFKQRWHETR